MKALVVYDSSYGNTKAIAETIATTLNDSGLVTDLFYVKDAKKLDPNKYDLLVVGSPTRFGTMSFTMKSFLGKIRSTEWSNKFFVAFDTENPENTVKKEWSAAEKIAAKLQEKNMIELSPVLKALVIGMKGPLVEGEVQRARNYALQLMDTMKRQIPKQ